MTIGQDDRRRSFHRATFWKGLRMASCVAVFLVVFICEVVGESASLVQLIPIVGIAVCVLWIRGARRQRRSGTARHRESMEAAFHSLKTALICDYNGDSSSAKDPESGVYQVDFRETAILDSKSNNVLYGGFLNRSVLTIQLTRDVEPNGWSIQGSRKGAEKDFYVISQGFVSPSGKAYWVETSNHQTILVSGVFQGDTFTEGEWLSSNGDRGRYTDFRRLEVVLADTAVVPNNEEFVFKSSNPPVEPVAFVAVSV